MAELTFRRIGLILIAASLTFVGGWLAVDSQQLLFVLALIAVAVAILIRPFWGLLLFALLIPLESAFLSIGGGTATVTRFVGLFVFGAWIFQSIFKRNKILLPSDLKLAVVFVIWGSISILWAFSQNATFSRIQTAIQLVMLALLVVNLTNDRKQLKAILAALFIGCLIATLLGLLGIGLKTESDLLTLQNQGAKEYGSYVGIVFLIGSILLVFAKSQIRLLGLASIIISIYSLIFVNQRGVFLAIGVAWLVIALITKQKIRTIFFIVLFFLSLNLLPPFLVQKGILTGYNAERLTIQNIFETGGTGRTEIWGVGWQIFADNFLLGTGWANFPVVFDRYANPMEAFTATLSVNGKDPHGDLIGVAGELGLVGLFLFLMVYIRIILRNLKPFNRSKVIESNLLEILVLALLIYIFSMGLTSTILWRKVYWLILGMGILAPMLMSGTEQKKPSLRHVYRRPVQNYIRSKMHQESSGDH